MSQNLVARKYDTVSTPSLQTDGNEIYLSPVLKIPSPEEGGEWGPSEAACKTSPPKPIDASKSSQDPMKIKR